ncbi:hypothetical protein ACFYPB_37225 [Streptomyces olivaceoviridis]|uniref:hypothetical protein n=1 Tax=Streptomyces olivaceoviridis TaxID=1921 RepID=UPI0036C2A29E
MTDPIAPHPKKGARGEGWRTGRCRMAEADAFDVGVNSGLFDGWNYDNYDETESYAIGS